MIMAVHYNLLMWLLTMDNTLLILYHSYVCAITLNGHTEMPTANQRILFAHSLQYKNFYLLFSQTSSTKKHSAQKEVF